MPHAKQSDQESRTGDERNPKAQEMASHFTKGRVHGFGPVIQRIYQSIVRCLDLSNRFA